MSARQGNRVKIPDCARNCDPRPGESQNTCHVRSSTPGARGQALKSCVPMFFSSLLAAASLLFSAAMPDTLATATVTAERGTVVSRVDTLAVGPAASPESLPEILARIPGIQINDYGGIAGLKNISLRGMGATHTAVLVDGVPVGNVQSGQIDLGMLDLTSAGAVTVDYVHSRINVRTARPAFADGRNFGGFLRLGGGSYSTWTPSGRADFRLGDGLAMSVSAAGILTQGNYRDNNDLSEFRGGIDLFGREWNVKAYANSAVRGCPGSVTWPAPLDRQTDQNYFLQGSWSHRFSALYDLSLSAKAASDHLHYNGDSGGYAYENDYLQREALLNMEHGFTLSEALRLAFEGNARFDRLTTDAYTTPTASRTTLDGKALLSWAPGRFRADLSALWTGIYDKGGVRRSVLSPSVGLAYALPAGFRLVGTVRRAYRVPMFNDLYYAGMGNTDLLPEDAWMSGLGLSWTRRSGAWQWDAGVDGFYNDLKNKIVSAPTADPFVWSMFNLGAAQVKGVDGRASVRRTAGAAQWGLAAAWTWQGGTAIPYQPRHSGSLTADFAAAGWRAAASLLHRGARADAYDAPMDPYQVLDLTLAKEWNRFTVYADLKNLLDSRYEVVSGYPMPGFHFLAGLRVNL